VSFNWTLIIYIRSKRNSQRLFFCVWHFCIP